MNLGSGVPCSIRELAETLKNLLGIDYRFDETQHSGAPKRIMDISLAKKRIHYAPATTLREGLMKTWEWFVVHPTEHDKKMNYFR